MLLGQIPIKTFTIYQYNNEYVVCAVFKIDEDRYRLVECLSTESNIIFEGTGEELLLAVDSLI